MVKSSRFLPLNPALMEYCPHKPTCADVVWQCSG